MIKPENGFFKQGCAFLINNQEITQYPITLILHDSDYVSWTAAGEKLFLNQFPYAYIGTAPWLGSRTNDGELPITHPAKRQILDLLLRQGEYGVIVYAVSEKKLRQPEMKAECAYIKKQCKYARHILLKIKELDHGREKDQYADEAGLQLAVYETQEKAKTLFQQIKNEISCSKPPCYWDKLNREWAEWMNYSIAEPLQERNHRILLVGDSISVGYGDMVQKMLPHYYVDRLNTSEGTHHINYFRMLQIALSEYPYEIIHINNGIHIHGISVREYSNNLTNIFQWIHLLSPDTKIIFAGTTCVIRRGNDGKDGGFNSKSFQLGDRVPVKQGRNTDDQYYYSPEDSALYMELNKAASQVCRKFGIPVNDLFELSVSENLPKTDAVHFQKAGYQKLAEAIMDLLKPM